MVNGRHITSGDEPVNTVFFSVSCSYNICFLFIGSSCSRFMTVIMHATLCSNKISNVSNMHNCFYEREYRCVCSQTGSVITHR